MTDTNRTSRWKRARRVIRSGIVEAARAQAVLWASLERIDPDPDPFLHWEPTTAGWRLHGHALPPSRCPAV